MPPPATQPRAAQTLKFNKSDDTKRASGIVVIGPEGSGKTTLGAHIPDSVMILTRGEVGYLELRDSNLVPQRPWLEVNTWPELLDAIRIAPNEGRVVVLDALAGAERLCHEYVCDREYQGDWVPKGFMSYQQGYHRALPVWQDLLYELDTLRAGGVSVLLLSHSQVVPFKNPAGEDFDRYASNVHPKTWGRTHAWASAVLFLAFRDMMAAPAKSKDGSRIQPQQRDVYTERNRAFDAKNRHGLPPVILLPDDPAKSWDAVAAAFAVAKKARTA
jgi:hypothetical protein